MLEDFRHFRNPDWPPGHKGFYILGPPAYWLVTALYNVFPLPRQRDFQASFAHAGKALDRGYNVMVFPEGTRSAEGQLARFRPGIGLLVKESFVPVRSRGHQGIGRAENPQAGLVPLRDHRSACGRSNPIRRRGDGSGDHHATARWSGKTAGRPGLGAYREPPPAPKPTLVAHPFRGSIAKGWATTSAEFLLPAGGAQAGDNCACRAQQSQNDGRVLW